MTDDSPLEGFNPFDALDREAVRLDAFFSTLAEGEWSRQSRCPLWTTRDMLSHLADAEAYHQACLDGQVNEFVADAMAKGATDPDSFNRLGVEGLADKTSAEVLALWRTRNLHTRQGRRERGDGMIDTMAGEYPNRWQAFHVASELATHADDIFVPVADDEDEDRWAWRVAFSRFALGEAKPDLRVELAGEGRWLIHGDELSFEVDEHELIEGVTGRLDVSSSLTSEQRALLAV